MNLTNYVQQVSLEDFGKVFRHEAVWNTHLKTTGGRFFPTDGHLDFNPKLYKQVDLLTFRKIVRHELCHYHLYFEKRGYRHKDRDFKELLNSVDGLRYAPMIDQEHVYLYQCRTCGQQYHRKRRINLRRFCCGKCRGNLVVSSG